MAQEVHQFTTVIPANTPKAALYVGQMPIQGYDVESVDIEVPPGPAGLMGFYVARSGQQWLPFEAGEFLIWDDRFDSWYLSDQPTGGGWQVVGYNLDTYDHSVVVRFHVNSPTQSSVAPSASLTIISGGAPVPLVTL